MTRAVVVYSKAAPELVRGQLDRMGAQLHRPQPPLQKGLLVHDQWSLGRHVTGSTQAPCDWSLEVREIREIVEAQIGGTRTWVSVDISGRIPGHREAKEFALGVLGLGPGIAMDDYSWYPWRFAEIAADLVVEGRHFFEPFVSSGN